MNGLIAVDGGGTKTEFLLADTAGHVLAKRIYSGTNLNNYGYDKAFATLEEGLEEFYEIARDNDVKIAGVYFGLAGGVNGKNQEIVYDIFKKKYFGNIPFQNAGDDLNSINVGVKNAKNGIAVIAGTGSNVMLKKDGVVLDNPLLSGWGYLFDNGASGFDFGRDAIIAAKREYCGLGEKTLITQKLEEKLGTISVFDALKDFYSNGPEFVASLSPIVFDAYKKGDKVAAQIIDNQVRSVAEMIERGHEIIGKDTDAVVGLVGGIFAHQKDILVPKIKQLTDKNLTYVLPEESQIYGALMEAAKVAGIKTDAKFLSNYHNTIQTPAFDTTAKSFE